LLRRGAPFAARPAPLVAPSCRLAPGLPTIEAQEKGDRRMVRARGFTLIELMIAIVIIGFLAMIAYPSYSDYVTRSKISEAVANLTDMRTKMEQYFLDNRTYVGACAAGTVAPLPSGANAKYFNYACSNLAQDTYLITATGKNDMSAFSYTIDQANTRVTASVPAGWTAAASCWTLRKDGAC
jgi:type IV pilus assembly protein PilE